MPKEKYDDIAAQNMRIQKRLEQKEHDRKLRALEKQQEKAKAQEEGDLPDDDVMLDEKNEVPAKK